MNTFFVLEGLKLTAHMSDNSLILSRSTVREFDAVFHIIKKCRQQTGEDYWLCNETLIYNKNKKRPRTDPWGTSELTALNIEE